MLPAMCPRTKMNRMAPVTAMTTLRPIEERQNVVVAACGIRFRIICRPPDPFGPRGRAVSGAGIRRQHRGLSREMGRFRFLLALSLCVPVGTSFLPAADLAAVVPDTRRFLEEVRQNLQSDEMLLDQYTFTEVFRESRLDSHGGVKKTRTEVYEVYPSTQPRKIYRRLISRDGTPLSEAELAEQDRKQEEKSEKREQRLAAQDEATRQAREDEKRRKERAVVDEIFRMDDIGVVGRETVDGRPTIIVSFTPRPGYKPV